MGLPVREVMRAKEKLHAELQLDNPALSDDQLLDAMRGPPDPDQPPHRCDAAGHAPVPAVGNGVDILPAP